MPAPQAQSPLRYFNSSPEVIRLIVMMYVRFPLSLRNVEDLLFKRGIDIATRPCASSGTDLVRFSPTTFEGNGYPACTASVSGGAPSTRST